MSDEPTQKKTGKTARPIGGIEQYATIGGKQKNLPTQTADVSTGQASSIGKSDDLAFELSTHQIVDSSKPQKFDTLEAQVVKPQSARKSKVQQSKRLNIERVQQTAWVPIDLAKWLRLQAVMEDREISEIVTEALEIYRKSH